MQNALKLTALIGLCLITGCQKSPEKIVVGASSTPHALILEQAKDYVAAQGYSLDIRVFNDYVLPNFALEYGELDANYFQHKPYLNEFNSSNKTHLVSVLDVHFEPMGVYQGRKTTLESYSSTDTIIVPSDKSNYDRAVALLEEKGLLSSNIVEVEAQTIPLMLNDCDYAVINGNYALSSGVVDKCLTTEDKTSDIARLMANIIAVREGTEESPKTKVLIDALKQPNIASYIERTFGDSVIYML